MEATTAVSTISAGSTRPRRACSNVVNVFKVIRRGIDFIAKVTINHDSPFYYIWLWVISAAIIYNIVVVPLRASFVDANLFNLKAWLVLDYLFADLIYLVDMFVRARSTFFQHGIVVDDVFVLFRRYFFSMQFVIDLISILPTDLIYIGFGVVYTIVRINRLLRLGRFFEMTTRIESNTTYPNIFRLATTVFGVVLALHYTAIFYHSYSKAYGFSMNENEMCEFQLNHRRTEVSVFTTYTYCLYWATMTLCFIGEMPPQEERCEEPVRVPHQMLIQAIIWLLGLMMFGAIVGRIGVILNNVSATEMSFQRQRDAVRIYLNVRKVSSELYEKVTLWLGYAFENRVIGGEDKVLKPLSGRMKAELASDMHLATLKRVQLFADLDVNVLTELVSSFRLQVFSPNDFVCKKGDIGREMYVVKRGSLEVVSDDGQKVFVTLGAGSVFGEISLLNIAGSKTGNRRTANVRSKGYSDLFSLSKDDLYRCLEDYPDAMRKLVDKGTEILRKEDKIDEDAVIYKMRADRALQKKVKRIEGIIEETETRLARLLADLSVSRKTALKRVEFIEQTLQLPPLPQEGSDEPAPKEYDHAAPAVEENAAANDNKPVSTVVSRAGSDLLIHGGHRIPTVKLMPATPTHDPVSPVPAD